MFWSQSLTEILVNSRVRSAWINATEKSGAAIFEKVQPLRPKAASKR